MDEHARQNELKQKLSDLDHELLRMIERRARLCQELSKLRTGTAKFAPIADGAHLAALEKAVSTSLPASSVRPLFTAIDGACRVHDVAPRVVFTGSEGDFGWIAAHAHFGEHAELLRADGPAAALEEVARSRADFAVVPYESPKDGPIFPIIQSIAALDLKLVAERELTQVLRLVNTTGSATDVRKVYASPLDHAACAQYLEAHHRDVFVHDVRSPRLACELAAQDPNAAAIVPRGVETPGLLVARENIGDEGEAKLRYGMVSRLPAPRSGQDATALLFSVHDRPGALHAILSHFKERSCNLRRIQSRPLTGEGWEYVFYVEVSGHVTDRALVAAIEGVKREAKMLKILGSFPLEFPDPQSSARPT